MSSNSFLSDLKSINWSLDSGRGLKPVGLFIGKGTHAIEVAAAESLNEPNDTVLTKS